MKPGGIKTITTMWLAYLGMFIVTAIVSWLWVSAIDREIQHEKENPDYKPGEGWLDWDETHTEGEL